MMLINAAIFSQSKKNDIAIDALPQDVRQVLDNYLEILSDSKDINVCGKSFFEIAGGNLLNPTGTGLRDDLKAYSLKRDFDDVKFYKIPAVITRINKTDGYSGYKETFIEGDIYKIWIAKKSDTAGLPAPISIIKTNEGQIKIINIGSL